MARPFASLAAASNRIGTGLVLLAIFAQAIVAISYGVPGHLSVDSIVQLYEGRTHQFISYHPPMMSLLLGEMDRLVPGAALFVLLNQALYTASLLLLLRLFGRSVGLLGGAVAAAVLLNPIVLAYTGIVWKDVLFAHLTLFGYVLLALGARAGRLWSRAALLTGSLVALALAGGLRQQGLLVVLPALVYGAMLCAGGWVRRFAIAVVAGGIAVGINLSIIQIANRVAVGSPPPRAEIGMRGLILFDLAGLIVNGGALADPGADAAVRAIASTYNPYRIDSLAAPAPGSMIDRASPSDLTSLWLRSIAASPMAYLRHRVHHFGILMGFGDSTKCLPLHVGVEPSFVHPILKRDLVAELRLTPGVDARAQRLYDILKPYFGGPLFRHWFWALLTVVAIGGLAWRRTSPALVLLGAAALLFAASYLVGSISCDFRYVYVLPVTATALLFALFVDLGNRRAAATAAGGAR